MTGNVVILVQLSRMSKQRQDLGVPQYSQSNQYLTLLLHLLTIVCIVSMAPYAIFNIIMTDLLENATNAHDELERMDYEYFLRYRHSLKTFRTTLVLQILTVLVALNPTLNFFSYFLSGTKFRSEVKTLIFCQEGRGGNVF